MKISLYTFIAFQLNGALGSGLYNNLSIDDVKKEIQKKTIFRFLSENVVGFDDSIISNDDKNKMTALWQDIMEDNIDEKLCVTKNGLSLLLGYLLEGIQREDVSQQKDLEKKIEKISRRNALIFG